MMYVSQITMLTQTYVNYISTKLEEKNRLCFMTNTHIYAFDHYNETYMFR